MNMQYGYGLVLLALSLGLGQRAQAVHVSLGAGQHGNVAHASQGYLGIDVRDIPDEHVASLHLREARGAEIIRVDHDGPAGKMGLRERDVVVQMNGISIDGEEQIRRLLRESAPGRTVMLVISRDGQQMTLTAQMADRSQVEKEAWEQHLVSPAGPQAPATGLPSEESFASLGSPSAPAPTSRYSKSFIGTLLMSPSYTGAMLEVMGPQLAQFFGVEGRTGLLVRSVENNSPAAQAGMKAGDVVVHANTRTVATMSDWAKTIREAKGRPVSVIVLRDKQEKTLTLTPDGKKRSELELPLEPAPTIRLAYLTEL
jgi:serine protease Do